ncbi:unnamed protein product [Lactuca saligna]|uniref:Uncharacterized protein n=1 Tax=Lactuca saligna TaxID=75948 RepID=A0AA35ZA44_LACSI|nr:unnamed protein product [Lactuca saligna]
MWRTSRLGFRVDFILRGMCFPFDVLDLDELVHWFEEDHDAHEVTSGRRPRSSVGCDFKLIVVIAWVSICKLLSVLVRTNSSAERKGRSMVHREEDYQCGLWSNSSREAWLHGKHKDSQINIPTLKKEIIKGMINYERLSEANSSRISPMKPNLEFTLGRPQ